MYIGFLNKVRPGQSYYFLNIRKNKQANIYVKHLLKINLNFGSISRIDVVKFYNWSWWVRTNWEEIFSKTIPKYFPASIISGVRAGPGRLWSWQSNRECFLLRTTGRFATSFQHLENESTLKVDFKTRPPSIPSTSRRPCLQLKVIQNPHQYFSSAWGRGGGGITNFINWNAIIVETWHHYFVKIVFLMCKYFSKQQTIVW